jgi:hypothetical protein
MKPIIRSAFAITLLAGTSASLAAQEIATEGPVPTTVLINVDSKHDAPLNPALLKLQVNRHDSPITAVTPLSPATAQVAILIDEGLRSSVSLQLKDLEDFINSLPAGVQVMVGYMQSGTVRSEGGFSANHEEVASQLRMVQSMPGAAASPYFSLSSFVKSWPSSQPGARIVMMITNGVDPYNGRPSVLNQKTPSEQAWRCTRSTMAMPECAAAASAGRATSHRSRRLRAVSCSTRARFRHRRLRRT